MNGLDRVKANAKDFLVEHPEIAAEIGTKIRTNLGIQPPSGAASLSETDALADSEGGNKTKAK